mmetsp:Transcript_47946/g.71013  ORF Transcript_47946/g.71013 Transcript_47946/m.71013 type:complete len:515 (-) Transcript_47946:313-1857(-)
MNTMILSHSERQTSDDYEHDDGEGEDFSNSDGMSDVSSTGSISVDSDEYIYEQDERECYDGFDTDLDSNNESCSDIVFVDEKDIYMKLVLDTETVHERLQIPHEAAMILLRLHNWNFDNLQNAYFEGQTSQCGVRFRCINPCPAGLQRGLKRRSPDAKRPTEDSRTRTCDICCMEDLTDEQMYSLPCDHEFCRDCWGIFLSGKIKEGPSCIDAKCPYDNCVERVAVSDVQAINPTLVDSWRHYITCSFVDLNPLYRFCPGPGCTMVATSKGIVFGDAECICGAKFCIKCGNEPHRPIQCTDLKEWISEFNAGDERWMLANTKQCPECGVRIEKNQGCNFMRCAKCSCRFCWVCMKLCDHVSHDCNAFDPLHSRAKEHNRSMHYLRRYEAHDESQKFAEKQLQKIKEEINIDIKNVGVTMDDIRLLKRDSIDLLLKCRRVLKFTYIAGSIIPDENEQKKLFEHHQNLLEVFTEKLADFLEGKNCKLDREKLRNHSLSTRSFMEQVVACVEDLLYS